jgi:hypothetical protein
VLPQIPEPARPACTPASPKQTNKFPYAMDGTTQTRTQQGIARTVRAGRGKGKFNGCKDSLVGRFLALDADGYGRGQREPPRGDIVRLPTASSGSMEK